MLIRSLHAKRAVIIGAGPAGLTAAYELLTRTDIVPIVLEKSTYMGGLSRSVNYKGNRIDIGGHRFFSKSERVVEWWLDILPLQSMQGDTANIRYHGQKAWIPLNPNGPDPVREERVMLIRNRKSRIYFQRQLFDYPVSLSYDTLRKFGLFRSFQIGLSYLRSLFFPIQNESNLEEFFINRFGRKLYTTFFKAYTEKVWGMDCRKISADWGLQRIKGLSLRKVFARALQRLIGSSDSKEVETSLIERFMYPKLGPGQMWEEVADRVRRMGGEILTEWNVDAVERAGDRRVVAVRATNLQNGESRRFTGDYVFSTMPMKELVSCLNPNAPQNIREIADGLIYREFMTVGVLCKRLSLSERTGESIRDNWIYIQEPDVLVGRIQIFNNWSPALIADPEMTWLGLEYFCHETDDLWRKSDQEMMELAMHELAALNLVDPRDIQDATVIRMPKAYPAYWGSYSRFPELSSWIDGFENLFLIGRNGMHKYNNQDHSMLAAMTAVDNIISNTQSRDNLWSLNTEQAYHEEKQPSAMPA